MTDAIKPILKTVNKNKGVYGSIIMTKDGIIISSDIKTGYDASLVAAISSLICVTLKHSLNELNAAFSRYILTTEKGKIFIIDIGKSVLIVLSDNDVNISELNVSIFQASSMIKKTGRIDV